MRFMEIREIIFMHGKEIALKIGKFLRESNIHLSNFDDMGIGENKGP